MFENSKCFMLAGCIIRTVFRERVVGVVGHLVAKNPENGRKLVCYSLFMFVYVWSVRE